MAAFDPKQTLGAPLPDLSFDGLQSAFNRERFSGRGNGMAAVAALPPERSPAHLLRVLGLAFGIAVGIGGVIGGGILRSPGSALNHVPLPWVVMLLWVFAGIHALLTANIVAEVFTAIPKAGGFFNVAERAFGSFGAVLVGWTDWLANVASVAALAIACAEFLQTFVPGLSAHVPLTAASVATLLLLLNWAGVREGSLIQMATSAAKAILLLALVGAVFFLGSYPTGSAGQAPKAPLSFFAIVVAYQLIVGAYSGWFSPGYFSEEDTNPGVNIPRGMLLTILSVSTIYILTNAALIYALPVSIMRSADLPISLAIGDIFGASSGAIVAAIAIVTVVGCINAGLMLGSRIFFGLAREGYLFRVAGHVNKGGTPDVALGVTGAFAILLSLTGQFETVFLVMGALGLSILGIIDVAFFKLRMSEPELPRPYRAIGYPWLPAIALILDTGLVIAFLAADIRSALFMVAAVLVCVPLTILAKRRKATNLIAATSPS